MHYASKGVVNLMGNQTRNIELLLLPILTVLFILTSSSCKKKQDDPVVPDKQLLMTINFTNDFINPKLGAIVFISDKSGNPLADTAITGNQSVLLYTEKIASPPYQVSIVKWEPDMHNFMVTIHTYTHVMPGEWTIRGNRLLSEGDATYSLKNIPPHSDLILYASSGYANLTFATTGNQPVYKSPDSLYVKINTAQGPMYKWEGGLVAGANLEIDLSVMYAATTHTISLPVMAQDFSARVSGYPDSTSSIDRPVATDVVLGDGTARDRIVVSHPPSAFVSFHTYLELIEHWDSAKSYTFSKYGSIPENFVKTDAAISGIQSSLHKVRFSTSGSFTVTSAEWQFQDAANLAFVWTAFGPDTLTSIILPTLPKAMTFMFPTLLLDSLKLRQFELIAYPASPAYPAYLNAVFDPEHPGKGNYMESSSVRFPLD